MKSFNSFDRDFVPTRPVICVQVYFSHAEQKLKMRIEALHIQAEHHGFAVY